MMTPQAKPTVVMVDATTLRKLSAQQGIQGIYAITPDGLSDAALKIMLESALRGGVRLFQYRNKDADAKTQRRQAQQALTQVHHSGGRLIVNDDIALALSIQADGVHLGAADGSIAEARQRLPTTMLIGASCYNQLALAEAAVTAGADYIAFGAVYPSRTKPSAAHAELSLFSAAASLGVPRVAIGGIQQQHLPEIKAAGAEAAALIQSLWGDGMQAASVIEQNAQGLCRAWV